ncbi:MAG: hypothetical protein NVS9B1_06650 [Candidatus Dormibacteraceae bacterium]
MDRQTVRRLLWPFTKGWPDEARRTVQEPAIRRLLARVPVSPGPLRVLNAGAGEGLLSDLLLDLAEVQQLVELDPAYASHPRPVSDPRQSIVAASITDLPQPDASFELVVCTEVLEHITDDRRAIAELARVLTPGGRLVISVPTPPAPADPAHLREGYTLDELTDLLAEAGLGVRTHDNCMHFFFRRMLAGVRRYRTLPRGVIRVAAWLDRRLPLGPPMDLLLIATKPG